VKKIVAGNTSQWRFDEFKKPCSAELAVIMQQVFHFVIFQI
jgi:hypothetical protein